MVARHAPTKKAAPRKVAAPAKKAALARTAKKAAPAPARTLKKAAPTKKAAPARAAARAKKAAPAKAAAPKVTRIPKPDRVAEAQAAVNDALDLLVGCIAEYLDAEAEASGDNIESGAARRAAVRANAAMDGDEEPEDEEPEEEEEEDEEEEESEDDGAYWTGEELEAMPRVQLAAIARDLELSVPRGATKEELLELILGEAEEE